jgi:hypothetical protein
VASGNKREEWYDWTKERSGTTGQKRGVVQPDKREEWYDRTKERSGMTGRKRGVVRPDERSYHVEDMI